MTKSPKYPKFPSEDLKKLSKEIQKLSKQVAKSMKKKYHELRTEQKDKAQDMMHPGTRKIPRREVHGKSPVARLENGLVIVNVLIHVDRTITEII